jgi:hypothetical protein
LLFTLTATAGAGTGRPDPLTLTGLTDRAMVGIPFGGLPELVPLTAGATRWAWMLPYKRPAVIDPRRSSMDEWAGTASPLVFRPTPHARQ